MMMLMATQVTVAMASEIALVMAILHFVLGTSPNWRRVGIA